jgi:hypothetical protein
MQSSILSHELFSCLCLDGKPVMPYLCNSEMSKSCERLSFLVQHQQQQQPSHRHQQQSIPYAASHATATARPSPPPPPQQSTLDHVATKDDSNEPVSDREQLEEQQQQQQQAAQLDSELESLCLSVTRHALD